MHIHFKIDVYRGKVMPPNTVLQKVSLVGKGKLFLSSACFIIIKCLSSISVSLTFHKMPRKVFMYV